MDNFNEIFIKYRGYALSIARAKIHNDDATIEDILQHVFLKLSKQDIIFQDESALMAWIKTATSNACIDFLRHNTRENMHKDRYVSETYNNEEPHTETDAGDKELEEIQNYVIGFIIEEIKKLTPKTKRIFEMYYLEDMDGNEIAEKQGISINTVYNHLMTARDQLRMNILFNKKAAPYVAQQLLSKTGKK